MTQVPATSQFEMGLSSIASILSNISRQTDEGNSFIKQLKGDFSAVVNDFELTYIQFSMKAINYHKMIADNSILMVHQLNGIFQTMMNFVKNTNSSNSNDKLEKSNQSQSLAVQNTKLTNPSLNSPTIDKIYVSIEKILTYLTKSKNGNISTTGETKSVGFRSGIKEFAQNILTLRENLTRGLIRNMDKFTEVYHKLVSKNSNEHIDDFVINIGKFTDSMKTMGQEINEPINRVRKLASSLTLLSFAILSPFFIGAIAVFSSFVYLLVKVSRSLRFTARSIFLLIVGMFALGKSMKTAEFLGLMEKFGDTLHELGKKIAPTARNISILALSMVALSFAIISPAFITAIGILGGFLYLINKFSGGGGKNGMGSSASSLSSSPMAIFALGVTILTLAMYAITEIPWDGVFKMIVFVGSLGLIMRLFRFDRFGPRNAMLSFAYGISVLVLAMFAINELPWDAVGKMLLFIGGLGLIMHFFSFDRLGPKNSMVGFAFGIGVLVLALYAMKELPWDSIGKLLLFIGGLGLVLKLYSKTSALMMIGVGVGIIALALALRIFKGADFQMSDTLNLVVAIGGIAAVLAIIGIPAVAALVGLGALVLIGLGASLLIAGLGFRSIANLDIKLDNVISFMKGATMLALGFAAISLLMIPGVAGALLFIPIAGSALLGAIALTLISKMNYDHEKIQQYMDSVKILSNGFSQNTAAFIKAAIGAVAFIPVAGSSLIGALVLSKISRTEIDSQKINQFGTSVKSLINSINSFGVIELAKAATKSLALLPIFIAGYKGINLLKQISAVDIDKKKLGAFGGMMNYMVGTILTSLAANESKMESAKPGLQALAKLLGVSKGLAETIQMMANLKFYDYDVKDGKLVLSGVRQLTSNDFKMVGVNLGTMLETLISPLTLLGSTASTVTIGGKTFANPFKNNQTLEGIDILAKLGDAYKPMAESIKTLVSSGVMTDPTMTKNFTDSLIRITGIYLWIFKKMSKIDGDIVGKSIAHIATFNNGFKNLPTNEIVSIDKVFDRFIGNLTDDVKWRKLRANLVFMRKEFEAINKSMNTLNIEKATIFEKNIRNLIEKNNGEGLKDAVVSLKELLDMVTTQQNVGSYNSTNNSPFIQPQTNNAFTKPEKSTRENNSSNLNEETILQLSTALQSVQTLLSTINSKLEGTLKVRNVDMAGNTIR